MWFIPLNLTKRIERFHIANKLKPQQIRISQRELKASAAVGSYIVVVILPQWKEDEGKIQCSAVQFMP